MKRKSALVFLIAMLVLAIAPLCRLSSVLPRLQDKDRLETT